MHALVEPEKPFVAISVAVPQSIDALNDWLASRYTVIIGPHGPRTLNGSEYREMVIGQAWPARSLHEAEMLMCRQFLTVLKQLDGTHFVWRVRPEFRADEYGFWKGYARFAVE